MLLCIQVIVYDLSTETIDENDVLIMATDGLWERVSNEKVILKYFSTQCTLLN